MDEFDVGDFTPANVLLSSMDWEEILRRNPPVRVIVSVRNPLRRALSALDMYQRIGWLPESLSAKEAKGFLSSPSQQERSYVTRTIERLRGVLGDGSPRLLIVSLDEIAGDPSGVTSKLRDFLGVEVPKGSPTPVNKGGGSSRLRHLEGALEPLFVDEREALESICQHALVM